MHLSTDEPAASRMLEPFREDGGDVPKYFSSQTHFAKIEDKKVIAKKIVLKTLQLEFYVCSKAIFTHCKTSFLEIPIKSCHMSHIS